MTPTSNVTPPTMRNVDAASADLLKAVAVDSMYGMHVRLGRGAVTLQHEGRTMKSERRTAARHKLASTGCKPPA